MNYDFIIYGGGISSKIAALALAKNNFKVCCIKNQTNQKNKSNLVTFLSLGSVNYLYSLIDDPTEFNKFTDIEKIICKLISANKNTSIEFDNEKKSVLGKIIPNKIIEDQLDSSLKKNKNIETLINSQSIQKKIDSNRVSLLLDEQKEVSAKVLILTANNKNLLSNKKIRFISQNLEQTALSMNAVGEFKEQKHAFQIFTPYGPLAFLPYSNNLASLVWSLKSESKQLTYEQTDLESEVNYYLEKLICKLNIKDVETHKLKFSFAKKLYDKNTVIIGNIAHNIHPIAGQGLNLSIKDISLFVGIISKYTSIGYDVNSKIAFEEFNQYRKFDNAAYSFGTLALDQFLASKNSFVNLVAKMGIKVLEKNKFAKRIIVDSAMGSNHFKSL